MKLLRALCLGGLLFSTQGAWAAEVINRFESLVEVAKNGTLTVTETIRVRAEGNEIKRGIYRDFPLSFRDAGGRLRAVDFKLLSVTRDGSPEPHFTKSQSHGIRIYAGKEDVFVSRGDHTYVFRYTTGRQIRWFEGKPELNWNVTGNFWTFPILAASYRLQLPGGVLPVRWTAFTGPVGAKGGDWRGGTDVTGALTIATTRTLPPYSGLTVVAEIPQGAVEPPSQSDELNYFLRDNRHWLVGAIGFAALLIYYVVAWTVVGRDPKRGIVIPLFHPPKDVSPALANYIHNWGFGRDKWRAFTAAAISLATRGLVLFDDQGGNLRLKATGKEPATALPSGEAAIFDWVKGSQRGQAEISRSNGSAVARIGDEFTESIEKENRSKFFRRNLGYSLAGAAMTIAVIIGVLLSGGLQDEDMFILFAAGFGSLFFGFFVVPILRAVFGAVASHSLVRGVLTAVVIGFFAVLAVNIVSEMVPGGLGDLVPAISSLVTGYPFPFLLIGAFATLNGLFFYLMRAPTSLGRPVMDQLDGFRMYMETAESDRLNMQAPELTTERFEALLPYAIALDVEKPWSEAFAAALRKAHPDDADPMSHYRPGWRSGGGWSGAGFGNSVSSTVASASSAFASAVPVSSGSSGFSSGGGGSGGGGGGGGGGGW